MLKLTRNKGERIIITHENSGEKIIIEVLDISRNWQVRLGVEADHAFLIDREEIYKEKQAAAKYRECARCAGRGKAKPKAGFALVECPDCEGEGKIDSRGYPPSYDGDENNLENK